MIRDRAIILGVTPLLAATTVAAQAGVQLRHVARAGEAPTAPVSLTVTQARTWDSLWAVVHPASPGNSSPAVPAVDFDSSMVVVVALGEKRSTGWSVRIQSVRREADHLQVAVLVSGPENNCPVGAALTYPWDAVVVRRGALPVVFTQRQHTETCH